MDGDGELRLGNEKTGGLVMRVHMIMLELKGVNGTGVSSGVKNCAGGSP